MGIEGIDIQDGLARALGNQELYRRVLGAFYASNVDTPERIHGALGVDDLEVVRHLAHRLHGSGANIGAHGLSRLAASLEHGIRLNQDREWIRAAVVEVLALLEPILEGLKQELGDLEVPR